MAHSNATKTESTKQNWVAINKDGGRTTEKRVNIFNDKDKLFGSLFDFISYAFIRCVAATIKS